MPAEELGPAEEFAIAQGWTRRTVGANGLQFHLVEAGQADAPPVLLLNGFPEFWFAWKNHIQPLADAGFRVIALDQRGYNLSDRPRSNSAYTLPALRRDVLEVLDALNVDRVNLVAHDWGGHVAWSVAEHHPERIRRLVILNVGHPVVMFRNVLLNPRQTFKSWYGFAFQIPRIPEWFLSRNNFARLRNAMNWNGDAGPISAADTEAYVAAWSRDHALSTMMAWYRGMARTWPRWTLPRIPVPTLLLWGEKDQFLDRQLARQSIALCERGRVVYLDATHWIHHEQQARVSEEIKAFLAS
jgi:pimeloyl-ACP methyl ester carboxylesterase